MLQFKRLMLLWLVDGVNCKAKLKATIRITEHKRQHTINKTGISKNVYRKVVITSFRTARTVHKPRYFHKTMATSDTRSEVPIRPSLL